MKRSGSEYYYLSVVAASAGDYSLHETREIIELINYRINLSLMQTNLSSIID